MFGCKKKILQISLALIMSLQIFIFRGRVDNLYQLNQIILLYFLWGSVA